MNTTTRAAAVLSGLLLVVGLAGCAESTTVDPAATDTRVSPSVASSQTTDGSTSSVPTPEDADTHNAADVVFAQMMVLHHQGALEMSELAGAEADSNDVKDLAVTIAAAQGPEIELMGGWLRTWGEPLEPSEHSGMDHGGMDMDGRSQEQVMDELRQATGPEFDRQFLTAMIAHHEGAVEMSEEELRDGQDPDALGLARLIIDAQEAQIQQMQQLLQAL